MADNQVGIKDIVATVRKDPALMIVAGVLFAGLLYYLYKRGSATAAPAVSTAATAVPAGYAPASGAYTYVDGVGTLPAQNNITVQPAPVTIVPVSTSPTPAPVPNTTPRYPGKSPFAYKFGQKVFQWTGPDSVIWSVGFGPKGHVWGVRGKVTDAVWAKTAIPPKTLLYQD